jgi:hypothetical protein
MYFRTVAGEWSMPNLSLSSSAILSSPYSGWLALRSTDRRAGRSRVPGDPLDERDVLPVDAGPARLRLVRPVLAEPLLLPLHNGLGLDDDERVGPIGEVVLERGPEQTVDVGQSRPEALALVDGELVPQSQVLHGKSGLVGKERLHEGEHHLHHLYRDS